MNQKTATASARRHAKKRALLLSDPLNVNGISRCMQITKKHAMTRASSIALSFFFIVYTFCLILSLFFILFENTNAATVGIAIIIDRIYLVLPFTGDIHAIARTAIKGAMQYNPCIAPFFRRRKKHKNKRIHTYNPGEYKNDNRGKFIAISIIL